MLYMCFCIYVFMCLEEGEKRGDISISVYQYGGYVLCDASDVMEYD